MYFNNFSATSTPSSAGLFNILISNGSASMGIYDIICRQMINGLASTYYLQFDSNTNSGTVVQTIFSNVASGIFGASWYSGRITLNGQYFIFMESSISMMALYQKISGQFIQIFNSTDFGINGNIFYIS